MNMAKRHWLGTPWQDTLGILMPPFVALALVVVMDPHALLSPMSWLIMVVGIDVAHVYSTIFRTYWTRESRMRGGALLWSIPLMCLVVGVLVHMASPAWFWRLLAYAAVWHFVRQQYGFMRLYQRNETRLPWQRFISALAIYSATIYPVLYWHLSGDRAFHWMVEGDFWKFPQVPKTALSVLEFLYFMILLVYATTEVIQIVRTKTFNVPKLLLIAGTYVSWYFGIVYFNGDWAFTALNVISHGIPYLTLIWITDGKSIGSSQRAWRNVWVYALVVVFLAMGEEALWDGLVWRDHPGFFQWLYPPEPLQDRAWLNLLVPLLALPQLVHYVLDGFIWRASYGSHAAKKEAVSGEFKT